MAPEALRGASYRAGVRYAPVLRPAPRRLAKSPGRLPHLSQPRRLLLSCPQRRHRRENPMAFDRDGDDGSRFCLGFYARVGPGWTGAASAKRRDRT